MRLHDWRSTDQGIQYIAAANSINHVLQPPIQTTETRLKHESDNQLLSLQLPTTRLADIKINYLNILFYEAFSSVMNSLSATMWGIFPRDVKQISVSLLRLILNYVRFGKLSSLCCPSPLGERCFF